MIERLTHLALRASDPAAAAAFAVERMGFELAHVDADGRHYLKAIHGLDDYSIVYVPGDEPGMDHASYLVSDLPAAKAHLEQHGVAVQEIADHEWNHAAALRFRSPAGHLLEFTTGHHTEYPVGHVVAVPSSAPAPVAADHVGIGAPDMAAEIAFMTDVLGLLPSNRIMTPTGDQVMSFLRAPGRYLYHCIVLVASEAPVLHHYQMTLKTVDSFYATYEALKAAGVAVEWGPLRHGPGHNIAMYFQDGAGYWIEYSVEEEIILDDEHYEPRTWTVDDPHVIDEWGTGPPPASLMGPPPQAEQTPEQVAMREQLMGRVKQMLNKRLYVGISKVNMSAPGPPPIEVINEHLEWALGLEAEGRIFAMGPFVDDTGAMVGDGLLIIRAESKQEAEEILAADPIHRENFRKCTVYGWTLHQGQVNVAVNFSDRSYTFS